MVTTDEIHDDLINKGLENCVVHVYCNDVGVRNWFNWDKLKFHKNVRVIATYNSNPKYIVDTDDEAIGYCIGHTFISVEKKLTLKLPKISVDELDIF